MPTPQVPFFLKNQILEEAHHSWAQYSIYTATLAVNYHRKPWMGSWSWHISFGPESSTVCKTRLVTQKSTSCDMWYSMPCGRRKEKKKCSQIHSGTTLMYIVIYKLAYLVHIFTDMRLSHILMSSLSSYNKSLEEHVKSRVLRSPQLRANPALCINFTLVSFISKLTASQYTKLKETENTDWLLGTQGLTKQQQRIQSGDIKTYQHQHNVSTDATFKHSDRLTKPS